MTRSDSGGRSAGTRSPGRWLDRVRWQPVALAACLLAVAGCQSGTSSSAGGSGGPAGSGAATSTATPGQSGSATPASQELCANQGVVTEVEVARLLPIDKIPSPVPPAAAGQAASGQAGPAALAAGPARPAALATGPPGPATRASGPATVPPTVPGALRITITDPAKVRTLARAVCALPPEPPGVHSCPIDVGGAIDLRFSAPGQTFPQVVIGRSGCQVVSGLGATRTVAGHPQFWKVLNQVAGALGIGNTP